MDFCERRLSMADFACRERLRSVLEKVPQA